MIGYADAGYLWDPHKVRSQTWYVFTCGGMVISWRSQKQTLIVTSSIHAEVITIYAASRECIWLRSVTQNIQVTWELPVDRDPTTWFEDNVYPSLKWRKDSSKTTEPSTYSSFSQELEKDKNINIQYIWSIDNAADLFIKAFPTTTLRKLIRDIGMRHLRDL